jgi:hypothetical protein
MRSKYWQGDVVRTGPRCTASFTDFVDPIHRCGTVAAWEIQKVGNASPTTADSTPCETDGEAYEVADGAV